MRSHLIWHMGVRVAFAMEDSEEAEMSEAEEERGFDIDLMIKETLTGREDCCCSICS